MTIGQDRCLAPALAAGGTEHIPGGLGAACGRGAIPARAEWTKNGVGKEKSAGSVFAVSCALLAASYGAGCVSWGVSITSQRGLSILGSCIIRMNHGVWDLHPWGEHHQPAWAENPWGLHIVWLPLGVWDLHPWG